MKQMMRSELDNKVKPGEVTFLMPVATVAGGRRNRSQGNQEQEQGNQEQDKVMGAGAMWARQPAQFVTTGSPTLTFED